MISIHVIVDVSSARMVFLVRTRLLDINSVQPITILLAGTHTSTYPAYHHVVAHAAAAADFPVVEHAPSPCCCPQRSRTAPSTSTADICPDAAADQTHTGTRRGSVWHTGPGNGKQHKQSRA